VKMLWVLVLSKVNAGHEKMDSWVKK